ncbi:MAG: hypothetical protein GTO05_19205, partial [Gemmatimonadales bacterium]|nr:hypothetical protein [Gemmatimonadales bacterium]
MPRIAGALAVATLAVVGSLLGCGTTGGVETCLDFADLTAGTRYDVGSAITTSG